MSEQKFLSGRGLDVGTSFIIASKQEESGDKIHYTEHRDAFLKLKPATPFAGKLMAKGLQGQQYFQDVDGSFIVVGQDAIERAIERNTSVSRPLVKGVISPKEKQARRILRHIFKEMLGTPIIENEKLVYSVPAQPVDQPEEEFDVGFHEDALNNDLRALGYNPSSISEAEAICYSELADENYTGISVSCGAGMKNFCLMSAGESIIKFSTCRSGDWIDRMTSQATAIPDTAVQVEKEAGGYTIGENYPSNPIIDAVSSYYVRLIDYSVQHLVFQLSNAKNLPKFSEPVSIVIAGGTSRAAGYVEQFKKSLEKHNPEGKIIPFQIKEVRHAKDPLRAVARGCLIASQL